MALCTPLPEQIKKLQATGASYDSAFATTLGEPNGTVADCSSFISGSMSWLSLTQSQQVENQNDDVLEPMSVNAVGRDLDVSKPVSKPHRERRCMACLRSCLRSHAEIDVEATSKDTSSLRRLGSALPSWSRRLSVPAPSGTQSERNTLWQSDHCAGDTDDVHEEQMHYAIDFDLAHKKDTFTSFRELKRSGQLAATASKLLDGNHRK